MFKIIKLRPFVLWISVLRRHKRPLLVAHIARRFPEMNFVLVGSSVSSEKKLAEKVKNLCKRIPNLYWLGPVSEEIKEKLINECTAGITTSIQEGFGLTPLEFLFHNKPVVASPLRVFKEIYGDLLEYAHNTEEYVEVLHGIQKGMINFSKAKEKIKQIQNKYDIREAALNMCYNLQLFSSPILILARDLPENSTIIQGNFIVEWKLWESLTEISKAVHIISTGVKHSKKINLPSDNISILRVSSQKHKKGKNDVEPQISVYTLMLYLVNSIRVIIKYHPVLLITSGAHLTILEAFLRLFLPVKVMSIIHDTSSVSQRNLSVIDRIKHKIILWAYNSIDHVVTVSNTSASELSKCLHRKVNSIWHM